MEIECLHQIADWSTSSMENIFKILLPYIKAEDWQGIIVELDSQGSIMETRLFGHFIFAECKIDVYDVLTSITQITPAMFWNLKIDKLEIPSNIKSIRFYAFRDCEISEFIIKHNCYIEHDVFHTTKIDKIEDPNHLLSDDSFESCTLSNEVLRALI